MATSVWAAFLLFSGWLNRFRGGGFPKPWLQARITTHLGAPWLIPCLLWWAWYPLFGWEKLLAISLGFAFWAMWAWGPYVDMGRSQVQKAGVPWIDDMVRPRLGWEVEGDAAGLFLRMFYILPFLAAAAVLRWGITWTLAWVPFWALCFSWAAVSAYAVGFRAFWPGLKLGPVSIESTAIAEFLTGALWGYTILELCR